MAEPQILYRTYFLSMHMGKRKRREASTAKNVLATSHLGGSMGTRALSWQEDLGLFFSNMPVRSEKSFRIILTYSKDKKS